MLTKNTPKMFWYFGLQHMVKIMHFYPHVLASRAGYKEVTVNTPDIYEFCEFYFWDFVWYFPGNHLSVIKNYRTLGPRSVETH